MRLKDSGLISRIRQLSHDWKWAAVFSGFRSWKWLVLFVTRVSKSQMRSQYISLPPPQPIDTAGVCACACGGLILFCMR